jgi:GNAT superfamily N-acetyltransferase
MDFGRDEILGIVEDQQLLVGVAHAAFDADPAEVALSVVPAWRGRGVGNALFASAASRACERGVARLYMQFLSGNAPILRIAVRFGMAIQLRGRDAEAHLDLSAIHREQIGTRAEIVPLQLITTMAS